MEKKQKGFELVKGYLAAQREREQREQRKAQRKPPQRLRNVIVVEVRVKFQGPDGKLFNLAETIG